MDLHNYPIDDAVTVADDRVRSLLRERSVRRDRARRAWLPGDRVPARRMAGWMLRVAVAEPLIVGGAGFLLGWLVSQRG